MTVLKLKRKILIQFSAFQHVVLSTNLHKREDGCTSLGIRRLLCKKPHVYYRNAFLHFSHLGKSHLGQERCIWSITEGDAFRKGCTSICDTALWQHLPMAPTPPPSQPPPVLVGHVYGVSCMGFGARKLCPATWRTWGHTSLVRRGPLEASC